LKKMTLSPKLMNFLNNDKWIFSKRIPNWPHEYIVRELVDDVTFFSFIENIREFGCPGYYFTKKIKYLEECGLVYWTTGLPVVETNIIYRCHKEDIYDFRITKGTSLD